MVLFECRVGRECIELSPELNQQGSSSNSNSDTMYNMLPTSGDVVRDCNSSSPVSSKEGNMDVKHFIEVLYMLKMLTYVQ